MDHAEMIELIRRGVPTGGRVAWADFGAGTGNFTRALAQLLAPHSAIYAVERDAEKLRQLQAVVARNAGDPVIVPVHADFARPLALPPLDGALLANSIHFNSDQKRLLAGLVNHLRPGGLMLIVEYDVRVPRPWIPHPVPFTRLQSLAAETDLSTPRVVGRHASRWSTNGTMYAAVMSRHHTPVALMASDE